MSFKNILLVATCELRVLLGKSPCREQLICLPISAPVWLESQQSVVSGRPGCAVTSIWEDGRNLRRRWKSIRGTDWEKASPSRSLDTPLATEPETADRAKQTCSVRESGRGGARSPASRGPGEATRRRSTLHKTIKLRPTEPAQHTSLERGTDLGERVSEDCRAERSHMSFLRKTMSIKVN